MPSTIISWTMQSCTALSLNLYVEIIVMTAFQPWTSWMVKHGCATSLLLSAVLTFKLLTYTCAAHAHCDRGQSLWDALLHGKVEMWQQAESPLTVSFYSCLLLCLSPLSPLCLFSCVRLPLSCPAAPNTSTIGSVQAGGIACPTEPHSAACRLRGM